MEYIFPVPLSSYPSPLSGGLLDTLWLRLQADPFNVIATAIFVLAVLHTFVAARFTEASHRLQARHDAVARTAGAPAVPSVAAELLHFLGEIEVVFGLWTVPLLIAVALTRGWDTAVHYVGETVNFTEPLFVVVIMAMASTRPVVERSENLLGRLAGWGGGTPAAWWLAILIAAPLLGAFITELFFLGFDRATAAYSTLTDFKTPLLVGFFLGGLVVHGGLQGGGLRPW